MQDNSFEKNTKQELHDLRIEPSEKVWLGVEKELDKKKRRYLMGWWWLLPLLLGGAGLLWHQQEISPGDTKEMITHNETTTAVKRATLPSGSLIQNEKNIAGKPANNSAGRDKDKNKPSFKKSQRSNTAIAIRTSIPVEDDLVATSTVKTNTAIKTKVNIAAAVAETPDYRDTVSHVVLTEDSQEPMLTSITVKDTLPAIQEQQKVILKTDGTDSMPLAGKVKKQPKKKRWEKEWILAGGAGAIKSLQLGSEEADLFYASPGSVGSNPPGPGVTLRYSYSPGIYIHAGGNVGRSLSKNVTLLTGLHYNLQSFKLHLRKDSFALYTPVNKWHLSIHSLNIPLLVKFSLGKKIDISTGLFNNITLSSNWNKHGVVLDKQSTYLPAFHLNPSYKLHHFSVGPLLNIGLNQYNNRQHMINYGIQLKFIPGK